jgi:hypothetical protein
MGSRARLLIVSSNTGRPLMLPSPVKGLAVRAPANDKRPFAFV